jgi:integrase
VFREEVLMGVYQRGNVWWIDFYAEGQRVRERVGVSKAQAQRALKARKGEVAQGKFKLVGRKSGMRLKALAEKYLEWSKLNKRSWTRDSQMAKQLCRRLGEKRLNSITSWDVEQYKSARVKEVSASTVNREVTCLKGMFNRAVGWGMTDKNPVMGVGRLEEPKPRQQFFSHEQARRLLDACQPHLRPLVEVALHTGMRLGELLALEVADVDLKTKQIRVRDSKSGKQRYVDISKAILPTMRLLKRRRRGGDPVFRSKYGKRWERIDESWQRALKAAGLETLGEGSGEEKTVFHHTRHTAASWWIMAGVDLLTVARLLGHTTTKMVEERYGHLSREHTKAAVERAADAFLSSTGHNMVTTAISGGA